ncbi:MAG: hypothetical protein AB4041_10455 [Microcystaceae cyanobacterium]
MKDVPPVDQKQGFFYPKHPYRGKFTPEHLLFNANLQEFAQKVEYIAGLHSNGKISTAEAYQQLHAIWQVLQKSQPFSDDEV